MKRILFLLAAIVTFKAANAQLENTDNVKKSFETENKDTVAWIHGGIISVGINEGLLHNWAAGGELGSLTVNGLFSGFLTRLNHNKIWSNNLDLTYGLFYAYSNAFIPRKTDDRIDLTSKYGFRLDSSNLYFTGLFNFRSQFTKGYDYQTPGWDTFSTSKFLSPAYFTVAAGVEYRKGADFSLFLSPLAARLTLVNEYYTNMYPEGAFGVEHGKTSRMELGAYFSGRYSTGISKKVLYKTRLDLYSNYLAKDIKDSLSHVVKKDNPGNIDILWDNLVVINISKYFATTIGATFIYDNDVPYKNTYVDATGATVKKDEPAQGLGWVQMKQIFTLGFKYKF